MPKVEQRNLSLGEILENKRRAKHVKPSNTITRSKRIGNLWYEIYQIKKV